jgi:pyruvate-ferredoxin/flavodoxin oxidoreductase
MKNPCTLDANEAVARVAYAASEFIAIYPITPASSMGEWADAWASEHQPNAWGDVPAVVEMQSEAGAAGAVHGALQTGSLATTFTASQGLLLMIPNLFKIAGELLPAVIHVAARSVATQALSIFGDHSDVMSVRGCGWAMLCATSVQEAQDLALVSHAATLESRVPVLHFFDGFRTSHEVAKIDLLGEDDIREMLDPERIVEIRARALSPDHPVVRGSAQNPDVFFQAREAANPFHDGCAGILESTMERLAARTGRRWPLYEYAGAADAERVVVVMGSAFETVAATAAQLNAQGEKVGVVCVRLYRPFDLKRFVGVLPATTRSIAVLDRTKEPGSGAEPLHLDVSQAVASALQAGVAPFVSMPRIIGGRYGLSSKEFTPAMARAVFQELAAGSPRPRFTVGIHDDVGGLSLSVDPTFRLDGSEVFEALFFGLGADGTVGANKETIKIIGENTENFAQGYFVYDSKKSGAITVSHLRFGPHPIRAPYLVEAANFVGVHQPLFLERFDVAEHLRPGGVLLLNTPAAPESVWSTFPESTRRSLREARARILVIDAARVARENGMGGRINTVMQAAFFKVSGVLPVEEAMEAIRGSIRKAYAKKGEEVVRKNLAAVDAALAHLHEVAIPDSDGDVHVHLRPPVAAGAPGFVRDVLGEIIAGRGDRLPVSAMPVDGTFPVGTARFEKRNLAAEIPVWDSEACVQCGKCVFVCPHAAIRSKVYEPDLLAGAPVGFRSREARLPAWRGRNYTLQVAPEDCTGCTLCVDVCPARSKVDPARKALHMHPQPELREAEVASWNFFLGLPDLERRSATTGSVREIQALEPMFEFSGACAGCGETPYLKVLSQLFGDHLVIANATGCSSIYGANLPTTPWAAGRDGRGPAWANSLFEDNAEFGLGFRLSLDRQHTAAQDLLGRLAPRVGEELVTRILGARQKDAADIADQRERVEELRSRLARFTDTDARRLLSISEHLVRRSVWIVGGDGWAYDIGYGGLDHVLASGANVKVLVLDTEVYSNTGGQCSKATPRGAVAKFASGGKRMGKKDLGLMAMTYGHVYVASVALGARDEHTLKALVEAENHDGPALVIAYSHCIAHGIAMQTALHHQKTMVQSGQWLLYRYNPDRAARGENPLQLDSAEPKTPVGDFLASENRFQALARLHPEDARRFAGEAQHDADVRWALYRYLASRPGATAAADIATMVK